MSGSASAHRDVADALARLTADMTERQTRADADRLRAALASALRRDLAPDEAIRSGLTRLHGTIPARVRDTLVEELEQAAELPAGADVLAISRRDERDLLLSGTLVDELTGIAPAERLGPFITHGDIPIWFDLYFPASRTEIRESGAATPIIVFTQARLPRFRRRRMTIDIEPGTVWVRGDALVGSLSASAFVGFMVEGGSLQLAQGGTVSGDVVEVPAPFAGVLKLELAAETVSPSPDGCDSAGASVTLPESVTLTFTSGTVTAEGVAGKADAWGQTFTFDHPTGSWTFVERLWTAVLACEVTPQQLDADPIDKDLVQLAGKGAISGAGLGLPVVMAPNPAILGEASTGASWMLLVTGLTARWYEPDPRVHDLDAAWFSIAASGVTMVADGIAPLAPPVTHVYDLWTIPGTSDKRLPWRQTYDAATSIFYRCHVVDGQDFLVQGRAAVAVDRPVTTNGAPVPVTTTTGTLLLRQVGGTITILLGAVTEDDDALLQFALRNALVWTGVPSFVFARGTLTAPRAINAGTLQLLLGVFGWAPTLPDPYVSNGFIQRPRVRRGETQSTLLAMVTWSDPATAVVSFAGQLGNGLALGTHEASDGEPRPARKPGDDPDVGPTQVDQDRLTFDRRGLAAWKEAQAQEAEGRGQRRELAIRENKQSGAIIDRYLAEIVGPPPNLLLLDVSTNQDLLGVGVGARGGRDVSGAAGGAGDFPVRDLAVHAQVGNMRVVTLPQVQWEPVRTLDADQDIMTMGWFPTPLASASDGGATQIGARSQKLMPVIPADALQGTFDAWRDGTPVGIRTTFPFGLIAAIQLRPDDSSTRKADTYDLTRPAFPDEDARGGIQITAQAEGGRPDHGGISATFTGAMRQLLNGVDLPSGLPLGISVLGSTADPAGSVESIFNTDMATDPRVPVRRIDLSGYGGSNFSDWNNPFAAFAETAKVQFRYMIGRTTLEVIKVNTVLHPWGIRVTRSVTIERRPGGGVIRRDSGWQAFTPGIFDYRYFDKAAGHIVVAPYAFDAGVFRGLFNVRSIRPAPGTVFAQGGAQLVPYYFDADVALEGVPSRAPAVGVLGYLQAAPSGVPADPAVIRALIQAQGPIGGPIDAWMGFGDSGLPFRAQRIEVGLADDAGTPLFVATARGAPKLPKTGAWSVTVRPVANVPPNGGEAVTVAENRGVPLIRRYPVRFPADTTPYTEPRLDGAPGDYRFADAADLLTPAAPATDYGLLQSTPTHAFLFPRPTVATGSSGTIESGYKPALADILARSTSKGAFPPPPNTIELAPGSHSFAVSPDGRLALSSPVTITGYPTPLRLGGTTGHGTVVDYSTATLTLALDADRWEAAFEKLRVWSDISGMERVSGSELRVVGSTDQRSQIAELKTLVQEDIEQILQYIPIFGARGVQGPIDLGVTNAKHEFKVDVTLKLSVPPPTVVATFPAGTGVVLKLLVKQSTGIDVKTGGAKASATFAANLDGKIPILSIGVATAFVIITGNISFSLTSVSGSVSAEKLDLMAFVGVGVEGKIGPFKAYAFLGIGFVLEYDAVADKTKYGGLVALEAGVDLTIVNVKIRAELKGLVYDDAGTTKCDYSGSVKIEVDIFLVFSISASYQVSDTSNL